LNAPPLRPWHRFGRFAVEHQGLVVPLAYVALVLLGMFHMALYYWRFGVNVIAFAQPVDFLLSPLSDVLVIVVSILPYDDCCALFAPRHPATRVLAADVIELEGRVGTYDALLDAAFAAREIVDLEG